MRGVSSAVPGARRHSPRSTGMLLVDDHPDGRDRQLRGAPYRAAHPRISAASILRRAQQGCTGHAEGQHRRSGARRPRPDARPRAAGRAVRRSAASRGRGSPGAAGPRCPRAAAPCVARGRGPARSGASASSPERPALKAASACGTSLGSSPRATCVERGCEGTKSTAETPSAGSSLSTSAPSGCCQAVVKPPTRQGATLSGWPSSSVGQIQRAVRVQRSAPRPRPAPARP